MNTLTRRARGTLLIAFLLALVSPARLYADMNNDQIINRDMARRVEALKHENEFSSEDFNACQITWTVRPLEEINSGSQFHPHEITFFYENRKIITLTNSRDGKAESIQGLGLNCLEFNDYVYLFFDTIDYDTRFKFNLQDLAYVIYSDNKGESWSELRSLHSFSMKAEFIIPNKNFQEYVKIFGNSKDHVLSVFNLHDETTYLLDPELNILKTVAVYNRMTDYEYPVDFYFHNNIVYLVRGGCEEIKGRMRCPHRTYMETSRDFGRSWIKEQLPYIKKSYFLTVDGFLYQFYFSSCADSWFGLIPAINQTFTCGYIKVRKLNGDGKWGRPKILIDSVGQLLGVYKDNGPVLVWQDLRFHRSRPCGYIPIIGCVDPTPFKGPAVIYAGTINMANWQISESIIKYQP
jgi:hypothetical protein